MTQPLSRLAIIGALSDTEWPQSHGGRPGFTVAEAAPGRFRVGYVSAYLDDARATADTAEILNYLLRPLRAAGWTVTHDGGPGLEVTRPGLAAGAQALAETDTVPYLAGRLVGLAMQLADWYAARGHTALCEAPADKIARGGMPPTANAVGQLAGMVWRATRAPGVPGVYGQALQDISERLGEHRDYPAPPWDLQGQGQFVLAQHHQAAALRAGTSDDQDPADAEDCEDLTAENAAMEEDVAAEQYR